MPIIIATAAAIEGRPVQEFLGIVSGEAAMTLALKSVRPLHAGRPARSKLVGAIIERRVSAAREQALAAMTERARELGATAVIAVEVAYANVGDLLIVTASGTAVGLQPATH